MADLNGDGLRDRVAVVLQQGNTTFLDVAWNSGKGFVHHRGYSGRAVARHPGTLQVADVDGDRRDDLIVVGNDPPAIEIAQRLSERQDNDDHGWKIREVAAPSARIAAVRHGDFNGDGLLDLMYLAERCWSPTEGPTSACSSGTKVGSLRVLIQQSTVTDVVEAILDEGGYPREEIDYARQWADTPEAATCAYPQVCHRRGFPVVRKQIVHEGAGAQMLRYTSYEDPRSDLRGRGFLGFGKTRVWEPQIPRETVTTFKHKTRIGTRYPFAGRPATVTVATPVLENDSDGPAAKPRRAVARVERKTMHYEARELNGGATQAVFPRNWVSEEWEEAVAIDWLPERGVHITEIDGPAQAPLRTRLGSTRFDDWGSLEREATETVGGVSTVVERGYEHRLEPWLLSLPAWEKVTSTTPGGTDSTVRSARFDFNEAGRIERMVVEPPELSKPGPGVIATVRHDDDDEGLLRGEPEPGVTATVRYDDDAEGLLRVVTQTALGVPARRVHFAYASSRRGAADPAGLRQPRAAAEGGGR